MKTEGKIKTIKGFAGLRQLLSQDEAGFERYVAPHLQLGDVWWIPDDESGFGNKEHHPWVIVQDYSPLRASILACPRTSAGGNANRGIITPAGLLPELDREGLIILKHRQVFVARDFRNFRYIGRLPEEWVGKIRDFYRG